MRRRTKIALAAVVIVALGAGSVLVVQQRAEAAREAKAAAERREAAAERRAVERAHEECVDAASDYLDAVKDIDAVVSVGVSYGDYSDLVRDAAIEQRRMGSVSGRCTAGLVDPLDASLKDYAKASDRWNDCLFDDTFSCDVDDLDLSSTWLTAGISLMKAEAFASGDETDGDEA